MWGLPRRDSCCNHLSSVGWHAPGRVDGSVLPLGGGELLPHWQLRGEGLCRGALAVAAVQGLELGHACVDCGDVEAWGDALQGVSGRLGGATACGLCHELGQEEGGGRDDRVGVGHQAVVQD